MAWTATDTGKKDDGGNILYSLDDGSGDPPQIISKEGLIKYRDACQRIIDRQAKLAAAKANIDLANLKISAIG